MLDNVNYYSSKFRNKNNEPSLAKVEFFKLQVLKHKVCKCKFFHINKEFNYSTDEQLVVSLL